MAIEDKKGRISAYFLPSFFTFSKKKKATPATNRLHSAGVDSLGMLAGSLHMSGVPVLNITNENITASIGQYHAMNADAPGTDTSGHPSFYTHDSSSILDGNYYLSRADIEKHTVIVPDISFIQEGDLLVKYNSLNEPHV